jgi:hypothetical protein
MLRTVSITFEQQKGDTKNDIITQHSSGDCHLCPIKVWASIIKRLLSHPLSSDETPINTFYLDEIKVHEFTGPELLKCLRAATASIGPNIFSPSHLHLMKTQEIQIISKTLLHIYISPIISSRLNQFSLILASYFD